MSTNLRKEQNVDNFTNEKGLWQSAAGSRDAGKSYPRHVQYRPVEYAQDDWEKCPKTDYTYARSASYNLNYGEQYINPNMSRPSFRTNQLDDSLSSHNLSDFTDTSTPNIKYKLRNRCILENVSPIVPHPRGIDGDEEERESTERIPTSIAPNFGFLQGSIGKAQKEDKGNSPMYQRRTLSHIYGTDGVSSTRNGLKERENLFKKYFLTIITTVWTVTTFPLTFALRKLKGTHEGHQTKKPRLSYATTGLNSGNHGLETHSKHEYFSASNFLYSVAGTIGGLFYVFRNLVLHLFGVSRKSSKAIDKAILSRTNKARDCHLCCLPLIVLGTAAILGVGYLYACGSYPSYDRLHDYARVTRDAFHEYATAAYSSVGSPMQYGLETYDHLLEYLKSWKWEDEPSPSESAPPSPTVEPAFAEAPSPPAKVPVPPAKVPVPPVKVPELPVQSTESDSRRTSSISMDAEEVDAKLDQLRKSLEDVINRKWSLFETQIKKQQGDLSTLESLKVDFHGLKSDLNRKIAQMEETMRRERAERSTADSERATEEAEQLESLRADVRGSLERFKEELDERVDMRHKELEGRMEAAGASKVRTTEEEEDIDEIVKKRLEAQLSEIFSSESKFSNLLLEWLSEKFVAGPELDRRMELAVEKLTLELRSSQEVEVKAGVAEVVKGLREEMKTLVGGVQKEFKVQLEEAGRKQKTTVSDVIVGSNLGMEEVRQAIKEALSKYDADKTGKTDFALESAGGSVLGTRCSKTYKKGMAQLSVFGIPLWYANNSPRTVIQPGSLPGECWPFVGSVGYLVVQLSTRVHVTEVSLEHVNVNITTFGRADSAPRDFSVWGLADAQDIEGTNLGNFTYDAAGEPIQFFEVAPELRTLSFLHVELRVHSNHGNEEYTCLYRFRVHGMPAQTEHPSEVHGRK